MLGLGYVASHAQGDDMIVISGGEAFSEGAQDTKDRELASAQAEEQLGETQQLTLGPKSDETVNGESKAVTAAPAAEEDPERQGAALLSSSYGSRG